MLCKNLPLELNLMILGKMDLMSILTCIKISKTLYFFFREKIFPNIWPYFNFEHEDIKFLHLAIMYEKRYIIKWLIHHKIYTPVEITINPVNYPHPLYNADVTLALSVYYSSSRVMKFLIENGVRAISKNNKCYGLEYAIARNDSEKLLYLQYHIFEKKVIYINNHTHITYFNNFALKYKKYKSCYRLTTTKGFI